MILKFWFWQIPTWTWPQVAQEGGRWDWSMGWLQHLHCVGLQLPVAQLILMILAGGKKEWGWSLDSLLLFPLLLHCEHHWARESFPVVVISLWHLRSLAFYQNASFYLLLLFKLEALKIFFPACQWPTSYFIGKAFLYTDNVTSVVLICQVLSPALTLPLFRLPSDSLKSMWGNTPFFFLSSYVLLYLWGLFVQCNLSD